MSKTYNIVDNESEQYDDDFISRYEKDKKLDEPLSNITVNDIDDYKQIIMDYVTLHSPKLYILTPCYGGMCNTSYVTCMINTIDIFNGFNIPLKIEFCRNDSLVTRARNNLIAKAMCNKETTHIIFIDSDISWDPMDIIKLLLSDKPLIGGIYPLKRYDWSKLMTDSTNPYNSNVIQSLLDRKRKSYYDKTMSDEDMIRCNIVKYNLNFLGKELRIDNNLAKVKHIATGFMMIQRQLIETMFKAYPMTKYTDDVGYLSKDEDEYAYALFDCGIDEGHYLSEDWLFCHRWSKIKGDVYVDVSIGLTHSGNEEYKGSFITSIM